MEKLFLLDAYALIYRAYYAFIRAPRINSKGQNTSAVMGFVNTLEEVLVKEHPDYIAVAFDPPGPTFRHEAYPEYKAQREATPEDIRAAVSPHQGYCPRLPYPDCRSAGLRGRRRVRHVGAAGFGAGCRDVHDDAR